MKALGTATVAWLLLLGITIAQSPSPFPGTIDQHPAINYGGGVLNDTVTVLQRQVDAGVVKLAFEGQQGFLRSVLEKLSVPAESQVLLFSKTGIQRDFTSPERPRALYFNDRVVVGYIPGAPLLEIASHDPTQGVIFRTLEQLPVVRFARPDGCLGCHRSANSMDVPGILVRSMFTAPDGRTIQSLGSFIVDHRSQLEQRWGGWYVTGGHGRARHMGNAMIANIDKPEAAIGEGTLNRSTLIERVDAAAYPRNTSDIAALLVFDHQGHAINLLTRLGWETRIAAAEQRLDFSTGELRDLAKELADYFVFAGEAPLNGAVESNGGFAKVFTEAGVRDRKGRSLRELDLQTRLFKYRCSYMIYSPAFDALPRAAQFAVFARLREQLTDRDTMEILDDTKPGWRE